NAMKFWTKGEDAPVAVWIGHHPAALIPANVKKDYPASHYPLTGSFLGEPLRLVPTELWGEKLLVPADAEIVFEGVIPRNVHEAEGPFGEYTGYAGAQRPSWIIDVQRVTHRKDAMYHDIAGGAADHLVLGGFQMEARVYDVVKRVVPELQNVHVPISGCCRFHAYLQLRKTRPGIGKDAISAAFAADFRIKHVFAVDEDIDIFNEKEILWTIATRSQWNRDLTMLVGGTASTLDPSSGLPFGCRAGIDCTLPPPEPGMPPPFPVKNKVPDDVMNKIQLKTFVAPDELAKMSNE
ncbi:MAG: UbiD family decarboxylase domain-containing protein, partial [Candidatus Bathyarchaeia archaeon]